MHEHPQQVGGTTAWIAMKSRKRGELCIGCVFPLLLLLATEHSEMTKTHYVYVYMSMCSCTHCCLPRLQCILWVVMTASCIGIC